MVLAIVLGCYGYNDSSRLEACSNDDSIVLCRADATLSLLDSVGGGDTLVEIGEYREGQGCDEGGLSHRGGYPVSADRIDCPLVIESW